MMKILKFLGLIVLMSVCYRYVPYGDVINCGVVLWALWNLVNN